MPNEPKPDPDSKPDLQTMLDEVRGRTQRPRPQTIGVCPTCGRQITPENQGHAPECNHTEWPQDA